MNKCLELRSNLQFLQKWELSFNCTHVDEGNFPLLSFSSAKSIKQDRDVINIKGLNIRDLISFVMPKEHVNNCSIDSGFRLHSEIKSFHLWFLKEPGSNEKERKKKKTKWPPFESD